MSQIKSKFITDIRFNNWRNENKIFNKPNGIGPGDNFYMVY